MNYVYAASGAVILIFVFLILKKKDKNAADYLLIGINVTMGAFMLSDALVTWKLTSETVIFQNGVPLLLFPLFVWYVLQFTHANKSLHPGWYLLFLPLILFLILSVIDHYFLQNYTDPTAIELHFNAPSIWYQLIFKGSQILFIGVLMWLLRALDRFELALKDGYSTIDTIDVKWLRHFTWIYLGSITLTFVLFLSQNLGWLPVEIKQVFGIVYGVLVLAVFYLNYQGIQHYTLSQIATPTPMEQDAVSKPVGKIKELSEREKALEKQMLLLIEEQQFYLEPKFSLKDLAEVLGKSTHTISRIINAREGRSFYDLINRYRVQHLQKLLDDPRKANFTILSLGLESGFNSKASLNRIFKNISGLTPRQYLDQKSQSIT